MNNDWCRTFWLYENPYSQSLSLIASSLGFYSEEKKGSLGLASLLLGRLLSPQGWCLTRQPALQEPGALGWSLASVFPQKMCLNSILGLSCLHCKIKGLTLIIKKTFFITDSHFQNVEKQNGAYLLPLCALHPGTNIHVQVVWVPRHCCPLPPQSGDWWPSPGEACLYLWIQAFCFYLIEFCTGEISWGSKLQLLRMVL